LKASHTRLRTVSWLSIALPCLISNCFGLDPARSVSQYVRNSWGIGNGFPQGSVSAIAQSTDGYLWIGTEKGLLRFDGITFTQVRDARPDSPPLEHVLGLSTDYGGGLWIRTPETTILHYTNGELTPMRVNPASDPLVTAMAPGPIESILFASRLNGVFAWQKQHFETISSRASLPVTSPVLSILKGPNGDLWLGTRESGLLRIQGSLIEPVTTHLPGLRINCLLLGVDNEIFVGTDRGLTRWNGKEITATGVPPALNRIPIYAMARDRDGNVWVGTSRGLLRLNSQGVSSFGEADSGQPITALFEDREGDIWAAGADELTRIQESAFVMYRSSVAHRLRNDAAKEHGGPVHADSRGTIWTGSGSGGLYFVRDGKLTESISAHLGRDEVYSIAGEGDDLWLGSKSRGLTHIDLRASPNVATNFTQADGLPSASVYSVHRNRDGTIWAGTLTAGASHLHGKRFTNYAASDGLASNTILSIEEDSAGAMWFATPSGLSCFDRNRWKTFSTQDGLPSENVSTLFEDQSGILWLGTLRGIAFVRSGKVFTPQGLPPSLRDEIFGIAEDKLGALWIASSHAVLRVDRARLLSGKLSDGDIREFGVSDGLLDANGVRRERSIVLDPSGRIWISRNQGMGALDPARLRQIAPPTIVHIARLFVDGDSRDLRSSMRLPANPRRIVLDYAGLNLSSPEHVRYKFKLDNFERDWNAPEAGTQAAYTNLSPGSYRFRVLGSSADQVWNGAEAGLSFEIAPAIWQTWWFRIVCAALLLLALVSLYRLRLHQLTEQVNVQFEARLAERTRIARELHDTLLQSFHGLMLRFQAAHNLLPDKPSQAKKSLSIAIDRAALAITEGRDAVQNLRNEPGEGDLLTSLTALGEELANAELGAESPNFRVLVEGKPQTLHPQLQEGLYRIAREAVANAFRHSNAAHIELDIRYAPDLLRLRVRDDGVGLDPLILAAGRREGHWGVPGMQERALALRATLDIWSEVNRGTEIELTIPGSTAYAADRRRLPHTL
jgi:signal transduction histidine kinase/ligand-binding sensor domain-containing protein